MAFKNIPKAVILYDEDGNALTPASAANQAATNTLLGAVNETAPASDTANSGLNGRLQRIAQRLTSLIALLPASLGAKTAAASLAVTLATDDALLTRVGEVQASPTSNTVLDRLKAIATALAAATPAGSNVIGKVGIDQTTPGTTNLVDTELPAAAALGDSDGNPTTPTVGAALMGWNTASWRRLVSLNGVVNSPSVSSVLAVAQVLYNSVSGQPEAVRSNMEGTLLASAARTAAASSADQTNPNARGVSVYIDVTVASGAGGLTLKIQSKDPVSGNYIDLLSATVPLTTTGTRLYPCYPGAAQGGVQGVQAALPRTWRVTVAVGDASSYTYSVGYALIN